MRRKIKKIYENHLSVTVLREKNFCEKITQADVIEIQQLVQDVVVRLAVPFAEKKISELEQQISAHRKGFQNALKYFMRKPKIIAEDQGMANCGLNKKNANNASLYALSTTVEGQMRLAADLCFLLRDYEQAIGYYKSLVSDFKQDKSWKHVGGCYEFWGLAAYLNVRWSFSVGISRSSGIFFKPQKSIILNGFSADSNKPIKTHCPLRFQQLRTTSFERGA
jgi:hypothetical protein